VCVFDSMGGVRVVSNVGSIHRLGFSAPHALVLLQGGGGGFIIIAATREVSCCNALESSAIEPPQEPFETTLDRWPSRATTVDGRGGGLAGPIFGIRERPPPVQVPVRHRLCQAA